MERGDWDNDADYPDAPLPAHERTWRHPSELGAAHWVRAEPPLVVGRGLSVATGTVGAVLALGLLWLMVPHAGSGSDLAVVVSTTSVRTTPPGLTPQVSRELSATTASTGSADSYPATMTVASNDSMTTVANLLTTPATTVATMSPVPTMLLSSGGAESAAIPPVAVALVPGHYVVTTAAAVRGREGFAVQLPSGKTVVGAVVAVDVANGTAVLSVTTEVDETTIEPSLTDVSAGGFTVMAPEATPASLWVDDAGTQVGYDNANGGSEAGEGSLVLDGDGRLMGLCTKSRSGVQLVTVATLLDALASASANGTPAWLGVEADLDASGRVTVTEVLDGGPAAAAGLQVGDVIVSVDGVPLSDLETLRNVVGAHAAGETVTLTIQKASADPATTTSVGTTSTTVAAGTSTSGGGTNNAGTTNSGSATTLAAATSTTANSTTGTSAIGPTTSTVDVVITLSQQPGSL